MKKDKHKWETGHRKHMTGGGYHDSRPNRERTRANAKRRAIQNGDW